MGGGGILPSMQSQLPGNINLNDYLRTQLEQQNRLNEQDRRSRDDNK
jgi:hypothetical protein